MEFEKSMKENVGNVSGALGHMRWLIEKNEIKSLNNQFTDSLQSLSLEKDS